MILINNFRRVGNVKPSKLDTIDVDMYPFLLDLNNTLTLSYINSSLSSQV